MLGRAIAILFVLGSALSLGRGHDTNTDNHRKIYYVETIFKVSFYKAFIACSLRGMELLSLDSVEEFGKVKDILKSNTRYEKNMSFWTAGVLTGPKEFSWMHTGLPVLLKSLWLPGQPKNVGGNEDCLELWMQDVDLLGLNDRKCIYEGYFVCQGYISSV